MDIIEMTKENFEKIPYRKDDTDLSDFYSAVIIPTGKMHDSGAPAYSKVTKPVDGNIHDDPEMIEEA